MWAGHRSPCGRGVVCLIGLVLASQSEAADWPQLRGVGGTSIAADESLAESWPEAGPPVLWVRELGQGYSSFAVVGERAYTQAQSFVGQSVICLDVRTGQTVWDYQYDLPYDAAAIYPGPRSTPAVADGGVFFASPDGLVGKLTADTGKLLWSVNLKERFGLRGVDFGYAASPVVAEGKLLLPAGGSNASLVALDVRDGSTVWATGNDSASYCSALPFRCDGRKYVVIFLENMLLCVDLENGIQQWKKSFSAGYDEHSAAPLYEEPWLMVGLPFRGGALTYRLEPVPRNGAVGLKAERAWDSSKMSIDIMSGVAIDGHIYAFDLRDAQSKAQRPSKGEFRCLDLKTGEVRWSSTQPGQSAVIAADGKLVLFNDRGEVLLVRQTPEKYEELGRTAVIGDEVCWTSAALARGRLFVRSQKRAVCLYLGRPEQLTPAEQSQAIPAAEFAAGKRIDLTRLLGGEREHPFVRPDLTEFSHWFAESLLGAFVPALVLAGVVWLVSRRSVWRQTASRAVFWGSALVLGMVATTVGNSLLEEFVFTWPVSIFVGFHLLLWNIVWTEQHPEKSWRWGTHLSGLAFLTLCGSYFALCQRLSLAHEPAFLFGLFPAFPVAVWTIRYCVRSRSLWADALAGTLSFSVYFWSSAGLLLVKTWYESFQLR